MLRLAGCKILKNRLGVAVDTQAALHTGQAIDMSSFEKQPDWSHPPNHSYSCHSRDPKGAEQWISPALSSPLRGVGSRTVTALADISDCTVHYNREQPQLTWYGDNGVLIMDRVRRDTNFGGGDVDAAVTTASLARQQRLHGCVAWAAIAQNDEPTGGQEEFDKWFETLVHCGPPALVETLVQLSGDEGSEAWFADESDEVGASRWTEGALTDAAPVNILAPWAKVFIQIGDGKLQLLRGASSSAQNFSDAQLFDLHDDAVQPSFGAEGSELSRTCAAATGTLQASSVGPCGLEFALSECSARLVRQLDTVADQASHETPLACGMMIQERLALGRQCWLVVADAEAWLAICQQCGAIASTESGSQ